MKHLNLKNILLAIVAIGAWFAYYKYNNPKVSFAEDKAEGIQFKRNNWAEVISLAKSENKLIFVDVYATWCGPCKRLKASTFADTAVGKYFNKNFINVSFDAEVGDGINFAQQYNVNSYPTVLIINSNQDVITKAEGFLDEKEIIAFGKTAIN